MSDELERPEENTNPDWTTVKKYIKAGMDHLEREGGEDKDFEHYVFEAVMEAMYGPDVWDWYNQRLDSGNFSR